MSDLKTVHPLCDSWHSDKFREKTILQRKKVARPTERTLCQRRSPDARVATRSTINH